MKTTHHNLVKQNDQQYAIEKIEATLADLTHPWRLTAEAARRLLKDFAEGDAFEYAHTQKDLAALQKVEALANNLLNETDLTGSEIHHLMLKVYYA